MITLELGTRRDTQGLGRDMARVLEPGDLVVLSGDLGAGKTFLVRAMARALGVPSHVPIASPTFTLVQEYMVAAPAGGPGDEKRVLLHADLYRLLDAPERLPLEIARLELAARRADGAIVVVEWGEDAIAALGDRVGLLVRLHLDGSVRRVSIEGARAEALSNIRR